MKKTIFLLDNYDSFTYNIYHALVRPGYKITVCRPHEITLHTVQELDPDALIFSPGPKAPLDYPMMPELLDRYARIKPILGICLGMQAVNEYFGGGTITAPEPVHGKVSTIDIVGGKLFTGLGNSLMVARYHSLILGKVPDEFRITAKRGSLVMAFEHRVYNIHGVQFHPESFLTPDGQMIFDNFFDGI